MTWIGTRRIGRRWEVLFHRPEARSRMTEFFVVTRRGGHSLPGVRIARRWIATARFASPRAEALLRNHKITFSGVGGNA